MEAFSALDTHVEVRESFVGTSDGTFADPGIWP